MRDMTVATTMLVATVNALNSGPVIREVGDPWCVANGVLLTNEWLPYSSVQTLSFFKDAQNIVHLQGVVKPGLLNLPLVTLPVGYRPKSTRYFAVNSNSAFGDVWIGATGQVVARLASVWMGLDGISFSIDAD